jgi:hypothetical protein
MHAALGDYTAHEGRIMYVRVLTSVALVVALPALAAGQGSLSIPRTPDGRPDLTGIYDANTVTPLERPAQFGNRRALTDEEAAALERTRAARVERALAPSDPNRQAPPVSKKPRGIRPGLHVEQRPHGHDQRREAHLHHR